MDICIDKVTLTTMMLLFGVNYTFCRGDILMCRERVCDTVAEPSVKFDVDCGYDGRVTVTWNSQDNEVLNLQLDYNCNNITGYSKLDALVWNTNPLSGSRLIPGNWSNGSLCTVWGCYELSDIPCRMIMEKSYRILLATSADTMSSNWSSSSTSRATASIVIAIAGTITRTQVAALSDQTKEALQTESKSSNWSYMYTTSSSYDTSVNTSTVVIATAGAVNQDAALSAHAKEAFIIPLALIVATITVTLVIVILTLITILFAIRRHGRRKEIIQLAGLANVIPNIEVDLTPQRTDVKSVHSADIVYSKLVFSQARVRIAEDSCRKGLEDVLDSRPMDGDQSVNEYVDETTLETELESVLCDSTATVIRPVCNELCQNEEEANNPEVQNRITGAPLMKNDLAITATTQYAL